MYTLYFYIYLDIYLPLIYQIHVKIKNKGVSALIDIFLSTQIYYYS